MIRPRPPRRAVAAVLGLLLGALMVGAFAAPAQAASVCQRPAPHSDQTIHIQGCLKDTRVTPAKAVPGVRITVLDDTGKQIAQQRTNASGVFDVTLPGSGFDVIGRTFTVKINGKDLPRDAELRDPKQQSLKVKIQLQADRYVTFPIGDQTSGTGVLVQALQLAVGGLVFALLLAMASLGLSMIFGTTGLTNFAHGELITFGALMAWAVDRLQGNIVIGGVNCTMVTGIIAAVVFSGLFGWLQDRILWRPLRRRGTGLIAAMIVSIGLSVFLRNVYQYVFGGDAHNYSQWTNPSPWHLGVIDVTPKDAGVLALSVVVLVAVTVALQRTRLGKATRAVSDNPALASSSGINVDRVISVVWTVGAALTGLSGVLLGMTQGFDYQVGFKILLLVFAAVILGGLGSIWGALVGSLIIGIFVEVSTVVVPAELKFVSALVVLIVVLLFRPQGLLGRAERVG